jgi:hypothetical protein
MPVTAFYLLFVEEWTAQNQKSQGTVKFITNLPTEWANANILPPTHPPFPPGTALQTQW